MYLLVGHDRNLRHIRMRSSRGGQDYQTEKDYACWPLHDFDYRLTPRRRALSGITGQMPSPRASPEPLLLQPFRLPPAAQWALARQGPLDYAVQHLACA